MEKKAQQAEKKSSNYLKIILLILKKLKLKSVLEKLKKVTHHFLRKKGLLMK